MDRKLKKRTKEWIKEFAKLGKELDQLQKDSQEDEFSQGQRQLRIVNDNFKKSWFSSVKTLFMVVK
jgi:hypothetical protein